MAEEIVNPFGDDVVEFEKEPLTFGSTFDEMGLAMTTLPTGHSTAYLADKAIEMSLIKRATNENLSHVDAFNDAEQTLSMSVDVLQTMNAQQRLYANQTTEEIRGIVAQNQLNDPASAHLYQDTLDSLDVVEQQYEGLLGTQKLLADKYSKESPLDRYTREQVTRNYATSLYKEWAEERGVLDKVADATGLLIDIGSFTLDANDLVTRLNPDAKGDAITNFTKLISSYHVLDPELKQQILPELMDQATKAYDNNEIKVAAFLGLLNDPDYFTESYATGTLEAIEVGTLLTSAPLTFGYKTMKALQRSLSTRQKLKALGNAEEAVAATRTPNRSPVDEAMDADATKWEGTYMGTNATDDLAPVYQRMTDEIKAEVVAPLQKLADEASTIKVDALTDAEKEVAAANYVNRLNTSKDTSIRNAEVIKTGDKGFTVRYQMDNNDDGLMVMQREVNWSIDDVGSLVAEDPKMSKASAAVFGSKVFSPEILLRNVDDNIVSNVTFGGLQSAVLRKGLADVWGKLDKGLNSKSKQAVDELLLAGDESETVFKAGDLLAGNVQTLSGKRKFTLEEVKAYSAKRAFLDEAWKMQNHIVKQKLEFQGFKETRWINPLNGIEEVQVAKPFKDGRGFPTDITEDIMAPGLLGKDISIAKRGTLDVAKAIEDGYVPVQFMNPIKVNGKSIKYGLVRHTEKATVSNLPREVLNKSAGYVPRISKPGYYYVKDTENGLTTVARAKTKEEAQAYADEIMSKQAQSNVPPEERVNLQVLRDRDMNALQAMTEDSNAYGGLYTGARNKQGIFEIGSLGNEVTRLSTGQSVQRMVDAISTQMPMNEYRIAVVDKWKNSLKEALKKQGLKSDDPIFRKIDDPAEWKELPLDVINDNVLREGLKAHRTYMIDSLRLPTNQENSWSNFMMNVADVLPNSKVRDAAVNIASKDPLQALKGATFDAYLGWFNPRQLYVQVQNAALAASMYPTKALGAVRDAFVQRTMLYTPTVDRELLARSAKGMDIDDIDDTVLSLEQFKASGLRDGVMRTGDYGANLGGFSQGTIEGYRKLAGAGRIFFEEGESMARLISWNIARKNWKEANPGKAMDDKAIRAITDDTLRMNMNMQRENASWWQKNAITAVPTQFLQVQAKLIENTATGLMGTGKWTQKEAAMVLLGQVTLYGTVGVPVVKDVSAYLKDTMGDGQLTFAENNPNLNKMVDQGFIGVLANGLGLQNNFSESGSILAGLDDNIVADMIVGFGELARGESNEISFSAPSIGVAQRGFDALGGIYSSLKDVAVAPTMETVGDSALKSMDSIASITSTWSNARKILFLEKLGGITNKRGNISISLDNMEDMNFQTKLAKMMGIQLDIETAYYDLKAFNYDRVKAEQETTKALKKVYNEFRIDGNLEKFEGNKALLLSEYEGQPLKRQEIINNMIKTISKPRSDADRELKKFITAYVKSNGQIGTRSAQQSFIKEEQE